MRSLLALLVLGGCSMYGAKPDPLHKPSKLPVPVAKLEPAKPVPYVETCEVHMHEAGKPVRQPAISAQRLVEGDGRIAKAETTRDPELRSNLLVDAVQNYRAALVVDPFNVDATLALARAYDQTLRKGCALRMLGRLASLATNPKLAPRASGRVQEVLNNPDWFKGYRTDATDTVQGLRPTP